MKLSEKLKIATQNAHREIEQSFYFKRLLSSDLSVNEYQHILYLWKSFLTPIEEAWQKHMESTPFFSSLEKRYKTKRLQMDMDNLCKEGNLELNIEAPQPFEKYEFDLVNPLHLISALYVMEGSTMGAMHIVKHLNKFDFCTSETTNFYSHYGADTLTMWQMCKFELDQWGEANPKVQEKVCEGAIHCFQSLGGHFDSILQT